MSSYVEMSISVWEKKKLGKYILYKFLVVLQCHEFEVVPKAEEKIYRGVCIEAYCLRQGDYVFGNVGWYLFVSSIA